PGQKFGVETVTLTEAQLPVHSHTLPTGTTGTTGSGQPHENMQPSLGMNFIIATQGDFQYLGEVRMFAGNSAPTGWMFANGQTLNLRDSTALFSRLGTTYGGNGTTTFALPDLRGRTLIEDGQGPGLALRFVGELDGAESVPLLTSQLPAHSH